MRGRPNTAESLKKRAARAQERAQERAERRDLHRAMKITNRNDTADADDAETIALFQLDERLTRADRAMLQAALVHPVDVDIIAPAPTAYTALWLAHYKLIDTWIDPRDRLWIRTTTTGEKLLQRSRKTA
jgi:hypothetical protein